MEDNKQYYLQLPDEEQGQVWDSAKFEKNKDELLKKYPDVIINEARNYDQSMELQPGDTFVLNLPGETTSQEWDYDKFTRNREKLYSIYPDATVQVLRRYNSAQPAQAPASEAPMDEATRQRYLAQSQQMLGQVQGVDTSIPVMSKEQMAAELVNNNTKDVNPLSGEKNDDYVGGRSWLERNRQDTIYGNEDLDKDATYIIEENGETVEVSAEDYYANPELYAPNENRKVTRRAYVMDGSGLYNTEVDVNDLQKYREATKDSKALYEIDRQLREIDAVDGEFIKQYEGYADALKYGAGQDPEISRFVAENKAKYDELTARRNALIMERSRNPIYATIRGNVDEVTSGISQEATHKLNALGSMEAALVDAPEDNEAFRMTVEGYAGKMNEGATAGDYRRVYEDLAAESGYLRAAKHFADKANAIINAPDLESSGFGAFFKGVGATLSSPEFWSRGLTSIIDNTYARKALERLREKIGKIDDKTLLDTDKLMEALSPAEVEMLRAFAMVGVAASLRQDDTQRMYGAGQTATESLGFMAEFLLSGGITGGVRSAAEKGIAKLFGRLGGLTSKAFTKGVKLSAARATSKVAGALINPIVETAVMMPLMPGTYKTYTEKLLETDDEGNLMSRGKAVALTLRDQGLEVWSEQALSPVLDLIGSVLGKGASQILDKLEVSPSGRLRTMGSNISDLAKLIKSNEIVSLMKRAGWDGYFEEIGEEVLAAGVSQIWDKNSWNQFWDPDNLASMAVAFAPMSVLGLGGSILDLRQRVKDYEEATPAIIQMLVSTGKYSQEEAEALVNRKGQSLSEIGKNIAGVLKEISSDHEPNETERRVLLKYASMSAQKDLVDEILRQEQQKMRNAVDAEMISAIGDYTSEDEELTRQQAEAEARDEERKAKEKELDESLQVGSTITLEENQGTIVSIKGDSVVVDFGKPVSIDGGKAKRMQRISKEKAGSGLENPVIVPERISSSRSGRYVHVVTMQDGSRRFILDSASQGDTFAYVDENGDRKFMTSQQIGEAASDENIPLNTFLDGEIEARRQRASAQREAAEKARKEGDARNALYVGRNDLNIDVDGQFHRGVIIGNQGNIYLVEVFGEDGKPLKDPVSGKPVIRQIPFEQAAKAVGLDTDVKTDMEAEHEKMYEIASTRELVRLMNSGGPATLIHNGEQYLFLNAKANISDESVGIDVMARDARGRIVNLANVPIEELSSMTPTNGRMQTQAEMQAEVKKSNDAKLDEIIAKHTEQNGDVHENALLEESPEAFVRYAETKYSKEDIDKQLDAAVANFSAALQQKQQEMDSAFGDAKKAPRAEYDALKDLLDRVMAVRDSRKMEDSADAAIPQSVEAIVDSYIKRGLNLDEVRQLALKNIQAAQERIAALPAPEIGADVEKYLADKQAYASAVAAEQKEIDKWEKVSNAAYVREVVESETRLDEEATTPGAISRLNKRLEEENAESGRDLPTVVVTRNTFDVVMREAGCSEKQISEVSQAYDDIMANREKGIRGALNGFQLDGKIFVFAEFNTGTYQLGVTMRHESQHLHNEEEMSRVEKESEDYYNNTLIGRIDRAVNGDTGKLLDIILKLSGNEGTSPYAGKDKYYLADELSAFALEDYDEKRLREAGAEDTLINVIKEEYGKQQNGNYWNAAREYALNNDGGHANSRGNVANTRVGSRALAEQGPGSLSSGQPAGEVNFREVLATDDLRTGRERELVNIISEDKRAAMLESVDPDLINTGEATFNSQPISSDEDTVQFSIRTEEALRRALRNFARGKEAKRLGWLTSQVEDIINETSDLISMLHAGIAGDPNYDAFAAKDPTIRIDWRDGQEKPVVTWVRNNIEYKYDMSADTFCINNEGLETVLASPVMADIMVTLSRRNYNPREKDEGHRSGFKSDDYLLLYETLRDLGFVVPCKGCFDAAARFKMLPSVAQEFVRLVNEAINERNQDPAKFDESVRRMESKAKDVNGFPTGASTKEDAIRIGVAGDQLTEHISWTQLMSAEGQTKALADWGGIFRAWQRTGAGRPKDKLTPEPYTGQIMESVSTIIAPFGEKTPSFRDLDVNVGTGLRRNSHSEFRATLAVDELQFMRDAWLKKLCVFKYMKELDDVRLFHNFGVKFNMSTFPAWVEGGVAAGLDANGDYALAEESVGGHEYPYTGEDGKTHYDGYRGFEEAKSYINKDCSLSSIAMSVPHLIKLMTDVPTPLDWTGTFGSLIPFHASGATAKSLAMQGLGQARAIGVGHSFIDEAFTDYEKGVTNFEDVQNDRFGEGWMVVSGKDAGKSAAGHKLEYPKAAVLRNEELGVAYFKSTAAYRKFGGMADFGKISGEFYTLDSENNQIAHPFSVDYNDKVREIGSDYAYKEAADFYINEMRSIGLLPRFDFEVPEEKFLEMCAVAKVDPTHQKLGWKGAGNAWTPCDSDAYYSLFCDYGMTDPATGKLSPHRPVLDGQTDADAFRRALPENYLDIIRKGLERYTTRKASEDARIMEAVREFCRREVELGRMTQEDVDTILEAHSGDFTTETPVTPETFESAVNSVQKQADGTYVPEAELQDDVVNFRSVFHGSGAVFDRFDFSHIGEGEGNSSFGWGAYVTEVENIGRAYAAKLGGQLYTIEIPEDNGQNYISYNDPLTYSQKQKIKNALVAELTKPGASYEGVETELRRELDPLFRGEIFGSDVQGTVSDYIGARWTDNGRDMSKAAKFLSELGIVGMKYPTDTFSERDWDGSYNFVMFNEDDLQVKDRISVDDVVNFRISNRNRATMSNWFGKWLDANKGEIAEAGSREATIDSLLQFVDDNFQDPTAQLAYAKWFSSGSILFGEEDTAKVKQAVEVARQHKVDPLQFSSPMEIINLYPSKIKEKPIDPETVSTIHRASEIPGTGIVIYDVDEGMESRENMRRIINTHFGKDCSPWCLLQGDENGNLTEASQKYWDHYNAYPKQVAFKEGKLIAFSANNRSERLWWDRQDAPHNGGVPVIGKKMPGDALGRSATLEYDAEGNVAKLTNIHKGNRQNGLYQEWRNGSPDILVLEETNKDGKLNGVQKFYFQTGELFSEGNYVDGQPEGEHIHYYQSGQVKIRDTYKDGIKSGTTYEYYDDGTLRSTETHNEEGNPLVNEVFKRNGTPLSKHVYDGNWKTLEYTLWNPVEDNIIKDHVVILYPKSGRDIREAWHYYYDGTLSEHNVEYYDGSLVFAELYDESDGSLVSRMFTYPSFTSRIDIRERYDVNGQLIRINYRGSRMADDATYLVSSGMIQRPDGTIEDITEDTKLPSATQMYENWREGVTTGVDAPRFRTANRNQDIFVSNAELAVEGLNMPKATPEQWLKAIQGRGGLKAGEDKWLGLSEWLQTSDRKSITKEEVLDFIDENRIQIEEVNYAESVDLVKIAQEQTDSYFKPIEDLQQEIDELKESPARYDFVSEDGSSEALDEFLMDAMKENYGDDFEVAYSIVDGMVEYNINEINLNEEDVLDNMDDGEARPIDDTRLDYTTQGLTNKREIALTVPTIESWGQDDPVHFDDAGEGRAVAWIRFGDAEKRNIIPAVNPSEEELAEFKRLEKVAKDAEDKVSEELDKGDIAPETADAYNKAVAERDAYQDAINAKTKRAEVETQKVLVIDEIQSKRHQEGREHGYRSSITQAIQDRAIAARKAFTDFNTMTMAERKERGLEDPEAYSAEYRRLQAEYRAAMDATESRSNAVPDAPFEKNWHELAMKRMLRLAAEEGYDYVAWTTGAQQAERYSIGGVVDDIYFAGVFDRAFHNDEKLRYIDINLNNGHIFHLGVDENGNIVEEYNGDGAVLSDEYKSFQGKTLADVVGKELAVRVLDMEEGSSLNGEGLRVGGEGMKGFYDDILPRFMDKYGKKWGVKTEDITLHNVEAAGRVMHAVPVTEGMKASVMEGQPMFRLSTSRESLVERTYRKTGVFSFTGKNRIENAADVAFIFRELENAAVENSFVAFVKDGKPTILHTGIGTIDSTTIDMTSVIAGYGDFQPDEVFMVHNHPSGSLYASKADIKMLTDIQEMMPDIPVTGIIIDTVSGQFGRFDTESAIAMNIPEGQDEFPIEIMSFDRMVFSPDYRSELTSRIISGPADIAAFLSAHRLGDGSKLGALLLNNRFIINGSLVTNDNLLTMDNASEMASAVADAAVRSNANNVVLFGNFDFDGNSLRRFKDELKRVSGNMINLTDGVQVDGDNVYSISDGTLNGMREGVRFRSSARTPRQSMDALRRELQQKYGEAGIDSWSEEDNKRWDEAVQRMLNPERNNEVRFSITEKERSENIWNSEFDSSYLQKLNKKVEDIFNGSATLSRYGNDPERRRGLIEGSRLLAYAATLCERAGSTVSEAPFSSEDEEYRSLEQEQLVEAWARHNDAWFDNPHQKYKDEGYAFYGYGQESQVYREGDTYVHKITRIGKYHSLQRLLDRIVIQNTLSMALPMEVEGFGKVGDDFVVMSRQRFIPDDIQNELNVSRAEIDKYWSDRKFTKYVEDESVQYLSSDYIVADQHSGNIIKTPWGMAVIDGDFQFNTPGEGKGGSFIYGEPEDGFGPRLRFIGENGIKFRNAARKKLPTAEDVAEYAKQDPAWTPIYQRIQETIEYQQSYIDKSTDAKDLGRRAFNGLLFADKVEKDFSRDTTFSDFVTAVTNRNFADRVRGHFNASNVPTRTYSFVPGVVAADVIDNLFNELNSDERNGMLYTRVKTVADKLGLEYRFKKMQKTDGLESGGYLEYNYAFFNSDLFTDAEKAEVLLHEMIHGVTDYLITYTQAHPQLVSDELKRAVKQLESVLNELKKDPGFSDNKNKLANIHELLAYTSDPQFREKLENKTLWKAVKDAIKKVFDAAVRLFDPSYANETNALAEVNEALDFFLDNADQGAFEYYHTIWRPRNWKKIADTEKMPIFESNEEQSRKDNTRLERPWAREDNASSSDTEDGERRGDARGSVLPDTISAEELGDEGIRFSIRTKPAPEETRDVWKLMRLGEDRLLYPLYIDRNTQGLELHRWYDADTPKIDPDKLEIGNSYLMDWDGNIIDVKPGLEGRATTLKGVKPSKDEIKDAAAKGYRWIGVTAYADGSKSFVNIGIQGSSKNKSGEGSVGGFAMRPGWHAGSLPSMKQIPARSDDMVWVKGKVAYGNGAPEEAAANGGEINSHIPVDGGYSKATSSFNEPTVEWYISGAFMPEEIMSDEDARRAVDEFNAENGANVPYDVERPEGRVFNAKTMRMERRPEVSVPDTRKGEVMMRVFSGAPESVRREIVTDALNSGLDFAGATGRYYGAFAGKSGNLTKDEKAEIRKVADTISEVLGSGISNNEAIMAMWDAGNRDGSLLAEARRSSVQRSLGLTASDNEAVEAVDNEIRFRNAMREFTGSAANFYNRNVNWFWNMADEAYVDMNKSVNILVEAIEKMSGQKAEGWEDIRLALNQLSSKNLADKENYMRDYFVPLQQAVVDVMNQAGVSYEEVERYMMLKHGLERNEVFAKRDAIDYYRKMRDAHIASIRENVRKALEARIEQIRADYPIEDRDAQIEAAKEEAKQDLEEKIKDANNFFDNRKKDIENSRYDRDADAELERIEAGYKATKEDIAARKASGAITAEDASDEYDRNLKAFKKAQRDIEKRYGLNIHYLENRRNDYSGIMSWFVDEATIPEKGETESEEELRTRQAEATTKIYDRLADAEERAAYEVEKLEQYAFVYADEIDRFNQNSKGTKLTEETDLAKALWEKVNAATKETLRIGYDKGLINKAEYDHVRNMFKYYVPLMGFKEDTAADVYHYTDKDVKTAFSQVIRHAKGRKTVADSPLGWIGNKAESVIQEGNKNEAKKTLYYFLQNRPDQDLITIGEQWYERGADKDGNEVWKPIYPEIRKGMTGEEVSQALEDFKDYLDTHAKDVRKKSARLELDKGLVFIQPKAEPEHEIRIRVNGEDVIMYVNGNPRAAQAINGLLNSDQKRSQDFWKGNLLRWLASVSTSFNPEFWISNFQRDFIFSHVKMNVQGDSLMKDAYNANYGEVFRKTLGLMKAYKNGTLGDSRLENYYREFADNGGITGYTVLANHDEFEELMNDFIKSQRDGKGKTAAKKVADSIKDFAEAIEQINRFAGYVAARESYKDIETSVSWAKEITANFNRKGSATEFTMDDIKNMTNRNGRKLNPFEQKLAYIILNMAGFGRSAFLFFNAAIQGLKNHVDMIKANPGGSAKWAAILMVTGAMNAIIHAMLDDPDDDNNYAGISDYTRRTNLLLGYKGYYIKWAIPQEERAFYAVGDILANKLLGKSPDENAIMEIVGSFTELLPLGTAAGGDFLGTVLPAQLAPIYEAAVNKNFTGSKLTLDYPGMENKAAYKSATRSTRPVFIKISKAINEIGKEGDYEELGWVEKSDFGKAVNNPAFMQHILEGYTGGVGKTITKTLDAFKGVKDFASDLKNGKDFDEAWPELPKAQDAPFIGRVFVNTNRNASSYVSNVYNYYEDIAKLAKNNKKTAEDAVEETTQSFIKARYALQDAEKAEADMRAKGDNAFDPDVVAATKKARAAKEEAEAAMKKAKAVLKDYEKSEGKRILDAVEEFKKSDAYKALNKRIKNEPDGPERERLLREMSQLRLQLITELSKKNKTEKNQNED